MNPFSSNVRFDRLATLYLANPLRKFAPLPDVGCVTILMYHRISDAPEPGLAPYFQVNTSPERFREQMPSSIYFFLLV